MQNNAKRLRNRTTGLLIFCAKEKGDSGSLNVSYCSFRNQSFPTELTKGEETCVFKANDQMIKSNYRPVEPVVISF